MSDHEFEINGLDEDLASSVSFQAGQPPEEMFRISPRGCWVRGVQVEQGPGEAQADNSFKEWLVWNQLTRP